MSLIDPACGSGTFLYKSAGRIVNALFNLRKENQIDDWEAGKIAELLICNNIVWFDIEPFLSTSLKWIFYNYSYFSMFDLMVQLLILLINQSKYFLPMIVLLSFTILKFSMEKDLQDLIIGGDFVSFASKRDPKSILQLKADLQDFDREALMMKFQLDLYYKVLQNRVFYNRQWWTH